MSDLFEDDDGLIIPAAWPLYDPPRMAQFKPYGTAPEFDLDDYKDTFEIWKEQWEIYLALSTISTGITDADARKEYTANVLKSRLSKATLQVVLRSGLTAEQLKDPGAIITLLQTRCNAGKNDHIWRQQFQSRRQRKGESIDDWLCDLRDIATRCNFAKCCATCRVNCEADRILGQIIFGVFSDDDRRRLLEKGATLTVDAAIADLRLMEAVRLQSSGLKKEAPSVQQASKSTYKKEKDGKREAAKPPNKKDQSKGKTDDKQSKGPAASKKCKWCGDAAHARKDCRAKGKECDNCGKKDHFAAVCRSQPKAKGQMSITIASTTPQIAAVATADMVALAIKPESGARRPIIVSFLPDTGAELDAIPAADFHRLFKSVHLQAADNPVTAVGTVIRNDGLFNASLNWSDGGGQSRPVQVQLHVLRDLRQPVLSRQTQRKLGMIPEAYPHVRVQQLDAAQHAVESAPPASPREPATFTSTELFQHVIARMPLATSAIDRIDSFSPAPTDEKKKEDLQRLIGEFPLIFDGQCRPMKGPPCHFQLKEGANPVAMRGSRPVSVPLMPRLKEELDTLLKQGIIRRVDEPTAWIHPIVVETKPSGGLRLCVDFRGLNKHIITPKFTSTTPFQAVRTIPKGMKFFTTIDALKGYHQVALDPESAALTTFSTPFGRFQYLRLPFGVIHAGDEHGRRVADVFDDIPNSRRVSEDIIVYSANYDEHLQLVRRLFKTADENQIAINVPKIQFAQPSVRFGGFILDGEGYRPDPELVGAIAKFPLPKNVTDLRSFFGLCQQIGNFSDQIATALHPLAPLLKTSYSWEWTSSHDEAFTRARKLLCSPPYLAFYDPSLPTSLHVDASLLNGLGFLLKQQGEDGVWRIVQAGSRFLSAAERRYAMIELECLAAAWAMYKCRQFLEGLPSFNLITDHRPLVPILNDYSLDKLDNPRLLRLRLKMQRFSFVTQWIAGKANKDADALSRAPIVAAIAEDELGEGEPLPPARLSFLCAIDNSDPSILDPVLERVKVAAAADPVMQQLRDVITKGFPNDKCNLPDCLRPYWNVRGQLSIDESDDMIVCGPRVVIPSLLRRDILQDLLKMHQGATKLRQRARMSIYWPGIDADIINIAKTCDECTHRLPSLPPEPLHPHQPATRPFEVVHADLGTFRGHHFLVVVDQFSGWPHVAYFPDDKTSTRRVIDAIRTFFTNVGVPVKFFSDNGPQFSSAEFKRFLQDWGIMAGTSSPHYAQSNGIAEAAIKSAKKIIAGSFTSGSLNKDHFDKALLLFRNAPRNGAASPAQLVFQRPVRDSLPAHRRSFATEWQTAGHILEQRARKVVERKEELYNRRAHPLPALTVGTHVLIQHPETKRWATTGVVVENDGRDYLVKTAAGKIFRRNRRFLRRCVPVVSYQHPPAAAIPPEPHPEPRPAPVPGPAQPVQPDAPPRRSARPKAPSTRFPAHTWTN